MNFAYKKNSYKFGDEFLYGSLCDHLSYLDLEYNFISAKVQKYIWIDSSYSFTQKILNKFT